MRTKLQWLFAISILLSSQLFFAQQIENKPQKPSYIGYPTKIEHVPSIASRTVLVRPDLSKSEVMQDGRASKYDIIPGKGSTGDDALAKNQHRLTSTIPVRGPEMVFETSNTTGFPTDPSGAVGPNHYFTVTNTAFQIFDKSGNSLTGGLVSPNPTIFPSGGCCDLTISYDNAADKWVITMLGSGAQIAVSDGPDPVNDGWTVYTWATVVDYQKLSIWSDGYYMTDNNGGSVHVFERDAMIDDASAGTTPQIVTLPLPGIVTFGFTSEQAFHVSNGDLPAAGGATIVALQDDAFGGGITQDHIKLWTIDMDWNDVGNSNVSAATQLGIDAGTGTVTPFVSVFDGGSFSNLPQPNGGQAIDALQNTIMNQAQFRKFPTYNSAIFNFVVDVDGSSAKQAAVRWYELRQDGDNMPWSIYQEGTYTAPDNRHAWMASMVMDVQGNIGMGYTTMSSPNSTDPNVEVSSVYTGRFANDPLGTMTVSEEVIMNGDANIPSTERYGDYSKIDIDPSNDKKFWFVTEMMSGGRKNIAGVFQLAPNTIKDVGVVSIDTPVDATLTNAETVTVTVFNFGEDPASGFDVTYQVDGGTVITEPFVGTLASQTSAQHTFSTTAYLSTEGQTYSIMSCTDYSIDEDTSNDCTTANVIHIASNDIGVTEITSPVTGEGLGSETVSVTIENFGTVDQSGFNINYIIDGGTPVVETVSATVTAGNTLSYSFTTPANLSTVGDYNITSSTLLAGDADASNNMASKLVTHIACSTETNATPFGISDNGFPAESIISVTNDMIISDVNVTVNLFHVNDSDLEIKLVAPDGTTEVMLSNRNGGSGDNFTNTTFDDDASTAIASGTAPFNGSFIPDGDLNSLSGLSSVGDWKLVITDKLNNSLGGTLLNWTIQLCANTSLSVDDYLVDNNDFNIVYKGGNHFLVQLNTNSINERLDLTVKNVLGQTILWQTLENNTGQGYEYNLNMSYAASGIYFVRVGNNRAGNVKRIIVK